VDGKASVRQDNPRLQHLE